MSTNDAAGLLLIGCGKMGGALLDCEIAPGKETRFPAIYVVDPSPAPERFRNVKGLSWIASPEELPSTFEPEMVILAVKPQTMPAVLPHYSRFRKSVFVSIAAGVTLLRLEELLGGPGFAIIRSMPNLPASIGKGITAAFPNGTVNERQRSLSDHFLRGVGDLIWLENEELLDAATAFAGGPAFVFALCESMARAGEALGFSKEMAMQLARQNVIGSGFLLEASPDAPDVLRRAVTSPAGTTEAALKHILGKDALDDMMLKAMTDGTRRAKELAR